MTKPITRDPMYRKHQHRDRSEIGNRREAPERPLAETAQRDPYEGCEHPIVNGILRRIIKTTLSAMNVR
jgi:hypothetical protein